MNTIIYSFIACLSLFLCVGLLSVRKREQTAADYLLAGRDVSPVIAGLSGAASTASGFMFTGIIGFGYVMGLSGIWFPLGAVVGSFLSMMVVSRRFRILSQRYKTLSFTEFITCKLKPVGFASNTEKLTAEEHPYKNISDHVGENAAPAKVSNRQTQSDKAFRILVGVVSLCAVLLYAAAQLTAGSKALHVLFDWPYDIGAAIGAFIILLYCWAGGIRASIWTDVVQIIVMYLAMLLLLFISLYEIGGITQLYDKLSLLNEDLVDLFPKNNPFGAFPYILGCLSTGISFIGFPHMMVRFMAIKKPKQARKAFIWFQLSYGGYIFTAFFVALCTRVLVPEIADFDPELALPRLALDMLPSILVGVILAGIFASTISTSDSLILSGTATLCRDIFTRFNSSYVFVKVATLCLTLAALSVALWGSKNVFDLVMFVVAIMGAGFAPLLFIRSMRWPLTSTLAIVMIVMGVGASVYWRILGYHKYVLDTLPGMIVAVTIYVLWIMIIYKTHNKKMGRGH